MSLWIGSQTLGLQDTKLFGLRFRASRGVVWLIDGRFRSPIRPLQALKVPELPRHADELSGLSGRLLPRLGRVRVPWD